MPTPSAWPRTPCWGTAADIMKQAMIDVQAGLVAANNSQVRLLLTVHDELVLEAPRLSPKGRQRRTAGDGRSGEAGRATQSRRGHRSVLGRLLRPALARGDSMRQCPAAGRKVKVPRPWRLDVRGNLSTQDGLCHPGCQMNGADRGPTQRQRQPRSISRRALVFRWP